MHHIYSDDELEEQDKAVRKAIQPIFFSLFILAFLYYMFFYKPNNQAIIDEYNYNKNLQFSGKIYEKYHEGNITSRYPFYIYITTGNQVQVW